VAATALEMPPALLPDGPLDHPLAIANCWTLLREDQVAYPVIECAVLPGQYFGSALSCNGLYSHYIPCLC
jgi:hypothetical protein